MKAKAKTIVITSASLLVGYMLGGFLGIPSVSSRLGSGDISKVSKYHTNTVDSQASAFEEKILNDQEAQQEASITVAVLNSRVGDFLALVDRSIEIASDKEELKEEVEQLAALKELSQNAAIAGEVASASFDNLISGKADENEVSYEQAAQNLSVAYLLVDKNVSCGKQFVAALDQYFIKHSSEKSGELALLRDLWAQYCAGSAYLNNNSEELAYWSKKENLLSQEQVLGYTNIIFAPKKAAEDVLGVEYIKAYENYQDLVQKYGEYVGQKGAMLNIDINNKNEQNLVQKQVQDVAQKQGENVVQKGEKMNNFAQKVDVADIAMKLIEGAALKGINNAVGKGVDVDIAISKKANNIVAKSAGNMVDKGVLILVAKDAGSLVEKSVNNIVEKGVSNLVEKKMNNVVGARVNEEGTKFL